MLLFLIAYSFTFSVYTPAKSAVMDVINASVAVVDEDDSEASRRIREALLPPLFLPAAHWHSARSTARWTRAEYTFVIDIPPKFQQDLTKGAKPTVEIIADATAMSQAGRGPGYIHKIMNSEVQPFWPAQTGPEEPGLGQTQLPAPASIPNMQQGWFVAVNQIINNISVLAIFLMRCRGAARARARHARTSAGDAAAPLGTDVRQDLGERGGGDRGGDGLAVSHRQRCDRRAGGAAPCRCSLGLVRLSVLRDGARHHARDPGPSMPQFGLLALPVFIVMSLLSGGQTPLESMPMALQKNHAVRAVNSLRQLFPGGALPQCDFGMVWPDLTKMFLIGCAYVAYTLSRFRKMLAAIQ